MNAVPMNAVPMNAVPKNGRSLVWIVVAAGIGACSGPEYQPVDLFPIIVVDPDQIAFGDVGVGPGLSGQAQIFVSNAGKAVLEVDTIEVQGGGGVFAVEPASLTVPAGEEGAVTVTFTPNLEYRDFEATIVLDSNDEETPRIVVPATGRGVDAPAPNLEVLRLDEASQQWVPSRTVTSSDDIPYGEDEQLEFRIENTGQAPLNIDTLSIEVLDGAPASTFGFDWQPAGRTLPPGGTESVLVRYTPDDETGETAEVHILSDDPDAPDTVVFLHGNGGGPYFEPPQAIIDCPATVPVTGPVIAHLDGSASYDPSGFALTYDWDVVLRPPASDASIPLDPDDLAEVDLYVDVAGPWIVQLVVTNEVGAVSAAAVCQFDAIPEDDIHVELRWANAAPDFDLHLAQSGSPWFSSPEDCMWCNKNPDWGVEDAPEDDPRLDIDDRSGFGPENINVELPADGLYLVGTHFWDDHGTPNDVATVSVWLDGVEVYIGSQALTQGQMWEVGSIYVSSGVPTWLPNGVVTDLANPTCPL